MVCTPCRGFVRRSRVVLYRAGGRTANDPTLQRRRGCDRHGYLWHAVRTQPDRSTSDWVLRAVHALPAIDQRRYHTEHVRASVQDCSRVSCACVSTRVAVRYQRDRQHDGSLSACLPSVYFAGTSSAEKTARYSTPRQTHCVKSPAFSARRSSWCCDATQAVGPRSTR